LLIEPSTAVADDGCFPSDVSIAARQRRKNHERKPKEANTKTPQKLKENERGELRCGASAAVDVAGPPSEVSMAATPPLFLALFFLFRFFAMAARRPLLVQALGARVSRGFGWW